MENYAKLTSTKTKISFISRVLPPEKDSVAFFKAWASNLRTLSSKEIPSCPLRGNAASQ